MLAIFIIILLLWQIFGFKNVIRIFVKKKKLLYLIYSFINPIIY